ncbi:MAG: amidohydrolase family protein [Actinobacteria bacterium]|nr:amidohydrolase family protein [Actinomycetota bacterium]
MTEPKESHRDPEAEDSWLSEEDLAKCARADVADTLRSPVPTSMVSNGEYMPHPQTAKQKRVEAKLTELADSSAARLGISRRKFLTGAGGMAAAFLAMNHVFGRYFNVEENEMFEFANYRENAAPRNMFVFDDQLHTVRSSRVGAESLRAIAQGPTMPGFDSNPFNPEGHPDEHGDPWGVWNEALVGKDFSPEAFHLVQFIKDVFLDSQVTVGLLSNVTPGTVQVPGEPEPRPPTSVEESLTGAILTAEQTAAVRNFVNEVSGSTRLLAHGLFYPGVGNLDYIQYQIDNYHPDAWKGYNINRAAKVDNDPESEMQRWSLDDEEVAYPTYDLITSNREALRTKPSLANICVHKGLAPPGPATPEIGHPSDIPKAATDWPNLNFIIYHSCIRPGFFVFDALEEIKSGQLRGGVPDISWTTEFAQLAAPFPNVYAEIGTTWASTVVTFPTVAAHILGQLMKYMGPDRIIFGSDSVWYGSPQWQIEALWRFEIPEEMRQRFGYPKLTKAAKRKILGLNSARLYRLPSAAEPAPGGVYKPVPEDYESRISDELKTLMEFPGYTDDEMASMRSRYLAAGATPSNTRYGWMRTVT